MKGGVLIIDDEAKLRSLLKRIIVLEDFSVFESDSIKSAHKLLQREQIDVVLCDVKLPDGNGVEFTRKIKEDFPFIEVIVLTAFGNIRDGVEAMQHGAFNYLTKGDDNARIIPLLNQAIEKKQLRERIKTLEQKVGNKYNFNNILGSSPLFKEAIDLARIVAPNDTTVLLLGETGTGKEVFAQSIHNASKRNMMSFVALNCSSFSRELLESELFGYKAGAFTSAVKDKKGLIEEADKGTLFLDEVGEMPPELQSKLLRVLETNEFIKLGETKTTKVDVRFIAATNRQLQKDVNDGKFREDLFYRLNVYPIVLPALRDRKKDIPVMAKFFTEVFAAKMNVPAPPITQEAMDKLMSHPWSGNIRELKNCIERAVIVTNGAPILVSHLPIELRETSVNMPHTLSAFDLASVERVHIQRVLIHTRNNKTEAAKLLNIGLATLYRKLEEYNMH